MPVLEKFIEFGVSGQIATLQPILSPMLWTSIATGKRADKHDILGFVEPSPDGKGIRPVSSTSRKCKAIWNILSQSGLRSVVINWFASHPAEPIEGTILTNRLTHVLAGPDGKYPPFDAATVHPAELLELAKSFQVHPDEITPQQMVPFFPDAKPTDKSDPRFWLAVRFSMRHHAKRSDTFCRTTDWDLLAVYFDAIDHAGHVFMEYHPPAMAHVQRRMLRSMGTSFNSMYRFHDILLGRLLDLVGPETTVIVLSDHGFYHDHLRPNVSEHSRDPTKKFGKEMNPVRWHRLQGIFAAAGKALNVTNCFMARACSILRRRFSHCLVCRFQMIWTVVHSREFSPNQWSWSEFLLTNRHTKMTEFIETFPLKRAIRGRHNRRSNNWLRLGTSTLRKDKPQEAINSTRRDRLNNLAQVHFSAGD